MNEYGGNIVARPKKDERIWVSLSTRIILETDQRLAGYLEATKEVKAALIDEAINEYLDKRNVPKVEVVK